MIGSLFRVHLILQKTPEVNLIFADDPPTGRDKSKELIISLPKRTLPQWTGFKIICGDTDEVTQRFEHDLNWESVTAWPGNDVFLVWSKVAMTTQGQFTVIRHAFLRGSGGAFDRASVVAISHGDKTFLIEFLFLVRTLKCQSWWPCPHWEMNWWPL